MKMRYDRYQVMAAAQFIWNNNPSVERWPGRHYSVMHVYETILNFARKHGMENMREPEHWCSTAGIGGFTVLFSSDDEDSFDIDVLVDPAVSIGSRYVEEFIDGDEEL
jgi:hypothetical protein